MPTAHPAPRGLGSCPSASSRTRCPSRTECASCLSLAQPWPGELSSARKGRRVSCVPSTPSAARGGGPLLPGQSSMPSGKPAVHAPGVSPPEGADLVPGLPDWRCGGLGTGHTLSGQSIRLWDKWSQGDAPTAERTGPCLPTNSHPVCGA